MKIGICDDRYEIRHKVKEILQETYTEEQGFLIHSYTPNEIKIDIEDMVFDCEILIMNTDYPESGLRGVAIAKQINAAFPFCKIIYLTENAIIAILSGKRMQIKSWSLQCKKPLIW